MKIRGYVEWALLDASGDVIASGVNENLVTNVGKQAYMERGAGISGAPAVPVGIKLGTGSTTPALSGSGSALSTYLANSGRAFDSTYPQSSLNGAARRIVYLVTYPAGVATSSSAITEAALVNDNVSDTTSPTANTLSRVLLTGIPNKAADQGLVVSWFHEVS